MLENATSHIFGVFPASQSLTTLSRELLSPRFFYCALCSVEFRRKDSECEGNGRKDDRPGHTQLPFIESQLACTTHTSQRLRPLQKQTRLKKQTAPSPSTLLFFLLLFLVSFLLLLHTSRGPLDRSAILQACISEPLSKKIKNKMVMFIQKGGEEICTAFDF